MAVTYSYNSDTFPTVDDTWDPYNQIVSVYLLLFLYYNITLVYIFIVDVAISDSYETLQLKFY